MIGIFQPPTSAKKEERKDGREKKEKKVPPSPLLSSVGIGRYQGKNDRERN